MTTKEIIITTCSIAGTLAFQFSAAYIKKAVDLYDPNIKKHVSIAKNVLSMAFLYLLPLGDIIYLFNTTNLVDKIFVITVAANISVLYFNILIWFITYVNHKNNMVFKGLFEKTAEKVDALNQDMKTASDLILILSEKVSKCK